MRKNILNATIAAAAILASVVMSGCGSSRQVATQMPSQQRQNTFGAQTSIPCLEFDTDEYYTGYGSSYGSYKQVGRRTNDALRLAQQQLIEKLAQKFNGFVEQSSHSEANNQGDDVGGAIKSAGLKVIQAEVGRLRTNCASADETVDANGNVTVHVGIRMYLKDLTQALMEPSVKDNLTQEERAFEEWKHEQSQEKLQKYLQDNKPSQGY